MTGRVLSRISIGKGDIASLAASPDGATLHFAGNRAVWSVHSKGGEARMVRAGDNVAMDPSGRSLVLPDGRLMALHVGLRSTLWKLQQVSAASH